MVEVLGSPLAITAQVIGCSEHPSLFSPKWYRLRSQVQFLPCVCSSLELQPRNSHTRNSCFDLGCADFWVRRNGRKSRGSLLLNSLQNDSRSSNVLFSGPDTEDELVREQNGEEIRKETGEPGDYIGVSNQTTRLIYLEERDEEILSKRMLKLSRLNKVNGALQLFKSMEFSGLHPNLHACNSLISCLLRNGKLDDALRIFECVKMRGMVTGHTFSLILKAVAYARGCDKACSMFEELEGDNDLNKHFDAAVYNTMISVSGKVNDWVRTERIWKSLQYNGQLGNTVTYHLLVCTFVRCGRNELALEAYREMVQNGIRPGEDAMQAVIGACAKEGKWEFALNVFQDMRNRGMKPSVISCNALINSLGKSGQVKIAFEVYRLMKSLGHAPDAYTWNSLLGALNRSNQHADALRFFESLKRSGDSLLNLHVYNTALMAYQRLGLWDKAVKLLWEMEGSGISVSTTSYNHVIGTCEAARKPKVALQVYYHMVHMNHSPDIFTLLSLLRCCIWGSLWKEVEEILHLNAPNGSLYNAAIQGMCLRGEIDLARKLYAEMQDNGLAPDGKTRALMLQNLPRN